MRQPLSFTLLVDWDRTSIEMKCPGLGISAILSTAPPDLDKICESVCPRPGISKNLSTAPSDLDKICESVCPLPGIAKNLSTSPLEPALNHVPADPAACLPLASRTIKGDASFRDSPFLSP